MRSAAGSPSATARPTAAVRPGNSSSSASTMLRSNWRSPRTEARASGQSTVFAACGAACGPGPAPATASKVAAIVSNSRVARIGLDT